MLGRARLGIELRRFPIDKTGRKVYLAIAAQKLARSNEIASVLAGNGKGSSPEALHERGLIVTDERWKERRVQTQVALRIKGVDGLKPKLHLGLFDEEHVLKRILSTQ